VSVCAGIVLYNPDVERLRNNINAIQPQVDQMVIVDNASDNLDEVQKLFDGDQFIWILNDTNLGIAKALNQMMEFADSNDYKWILTLDQDSICEDDLVKKLMSVSVDRKDTGEKSNTDNIAMVAPIIIDRGTPDGNLRSDESVSEVEEIKFCITSGCLTNVKTVFDIGGFNEWLFVYDVDREICIRLLRHGYRIVRVNTAELYHEHGLKTVHKKLLWKKVTYRNYTPFSVFYMTRNLVYMLRKYGSEYSPRPFLRWVRLYFAFCVKFICEPDRMLRLKAFTKGIREGYAVNINEM